MKALDMIVAVMAIDEEYGFNEPFVLNEYFINEVFGALTNDGIISIDIVKPHRGERYSILIRPSRKLERDYETTFRTMMIWVEGKEWYPVLNALRRKAERTGR
jgi:hypothetical protein